MASSDFTTNLHLSAWRDSDRPKRADFVSDNNIIDTQLGGHILDTAIHLSAQQQDKLNAPFGGFVYQGNGEASRTIQLSYVPKYAVVFKRDTAPVTYDNGVTTANLGFAINGFGNTVGVSLSNLGVTVQQIAQNADGVCVNLNESGAQYAMITFK